jgi:cell division transport system permease protein
LVQCTGEERAQQFHDLCLPEKELIINYQPSINAMKAKHHSVSYFDMQFITSSISTTLVLLLLGLVVFFVLAAHNLSIYVKENINFSILISDDMKESEILKLQKKLDKEAFVKETEYISKKQALREQTEAMGTDPQEFLGYNPFTASIEIKLHSDYANSDSIAKIEKLIKKNTNIQEVLYQKDLIDAVNDNIRNISLMLLGLAVILTFISFALINNTIRLAIYSKRFLIHTMKLVGASWSFIRRPFLRRNFWIGVLSAAVADGILWGAAYWLVSYEPDLIRVITPNVMLLVSVSVLVFGVLITWLCALLSINKYLKMKASTLYYI